MRFVLDTNIIVSGFISPHRAPAALLLAVRRERAVLVTSSAQLDELGYVVSRARIQKYLVPGAVENFQETVDALALIVPGPLPKVTESPDPDDNLILATALAGEAELIVSGDKRHVLALKVFRGISIVTAARAVEILEQKAAGTSS